MDATATVAAEGRDTAMRESAVRIPVATNMSVAAALVAANLLQFVLLPVALLPVDPAWGWLLAAVALSAPTHWAMVHEAIHGMLLPSPRWNERVGRTLAVLFGSPFQLLRLGHLMHHRFNRTCLNRTEVVEPPKRPGLADRLAYFGRLFGGLYLGELLASPLAVAPDRFYRPVIRLAFGDEAPDGRTMWRAARRQLLEEPGRSRMRLDGLIVTAGLAASFWLYGEHWWMLAAALGGRAFLISFLDNAYHYGAPLDDVMSGYNLRAPAPVMRAYLNFNLHASHHRRPSVPWSGLPAVTSDLGLGYRDGLAAAALRQLRGPLPADRLAADRGDRRPLQKGHGGG